MKRRKNLIIAFLLIASLALGIGYAAYTTTLTINGQAGVSSEAIEFTNDVVFIECSSSNDAFGTASLVDEQTASFITTGMTQAQERVQFTYVIANNSDTAVSVTISTHPSTSDTSNTFSVTTSLGGDPVEIPAGGRINASVTVVLNQTVTSPVENIEYLIRYTATSVEP